MNTSKFSPGDTVRVIDSAEAPSEWAIFVISSIENDRFLLSAIDGKKPLEAFWAENEHIVSLSCQTME